MILKYKMYEHKHFNFNFIFNVNLKFFFDNLNSMLTLFKCVDVLSSLYYDGMHYSHSFN